MLLNGFFKSNILSMAKAKHSLDLSVVIIVIFVGNLTHDILYIIYYLDEMIDMIDIILI